MQKIVLNLLVLFSISACASNSNTVSQSDLLRGLDSVYPIRIGESQQSVIFNPTIVKHLGSKTSDKSQISLRFPVAVSPSGNNSYAGRGEVQVQTKIRFNGKALVFQILNTKYNYGDLPSLYKSSLDFYFKNHLTDLSVNGIPIIDTLNGEKTDVYDSAQFPKVNIITP